MARASQQSAGAITVWLIIFAALWLTSTVFLIVLYTGQEELVAENNRVTQKNRKLISAQETKSIALIGNMSESRTAVGILEDARRATALLACGEESDDPAAVRAKRDKILGEIQADGFVPKAAAFEDVSLLEGLTLLYGAYRSKHARLAEMHNRLTSLESDVERLEREKSALATGFAEQAKELTEQFAESEAQRTAYRAERDGAIEELQRDFEARRAQGDEALKDARLMSTQLASDLDALRKRLAAQEEKFGSLLIGPETLATARQPDGQILTAIPGDTVVYIDLGRDDRLALGLTFAVYASEDGVPADGRAKAQIEVVTISESSAECRITGIAPGEIVLQGDLIANPIYDRMRPQAFLIAGNFDLDRDGVADPSGGAVIEALIHEWGGVLTEDVSARTDFVVLGTAPRRPKRGGDRGLSAEESSRLARMQQAWDRYVDTLASARALSVPILSQDLFLNFLGYRGRQGFRAPL